MSAPDNPSAFPVNADNVGGPGAYAPDPGMTLRDYFAGQVLSALDTNFNVANTSDAQLHDMAGQIYRIADAMLLARTKGGAA